MAELVSRITVFVASPGDVTQERDVIRDTIDQLNQTASLGENTVVQLKGWETHAWPGFGDDAQSVINRQIGPYDVFIGIMWNRIGTRTGRAQSGTVEEFERAYAAWKEHKRPSLMFYFNRAPSYLATARELQQKAELLKFKNSLHGIGALYWEYDGVDEFRKLLPVHLLNELKSHFRPLSSHGAVPNVPESFTDAEQWPHLLRIGSWKLDPNTNALRGKGVHEFLLSRQNYGKRNFGIKASLVFMNYDQYRKAGMDTANAGIVMGWQEHGRGHRYYNLLFTGSRLLLEAVGFSGGDDYRDFEHLDEGVPLKVDGERSYDLGISVTGSDIDVFIDNELQYSVPAPKDLVGRVGLRPWRAEIACSKFIITEG